MRRGVQEGGEALTARSRSNRVIGGTAKTIVTRDARGAAAAPARDIRAWHGVTTSGTTILLWALAGLLLLFLAIPVGALMIRALGAGEGWDGRTYETLRQALGLSLATTAVTMGLVIVLGTPLAYLLARRRFRGAASVEALVDLPIVLPPAVAGIALLVAFGRHGLVGQWLTEGGITLGFTTSAVLLAQVFVSAPFYVIAARAG